MQRSIAKKSTEKLKQDSKFIKITQRKTGIGKHRKRRDKEKANNQYQRWKYNHINEELNVQI